jgi:RNA polymerase subunit RPABC4/transcription elongation factor Spt4
MSTTILHCANCHKRLPEAANFCPFCGRPTRDAEISRFKGQPTEQSAHPHEADAKWQLMLVRPDGEQMVSEITNELTIGRSPKNDMRLDDQMVSRFHARIEKTDLGYEIRDLDSMNGTAVNRKKLVIPVILKVGDAITIGEHRLLVQHKTSRCGNCRREVSAEHLFCRNCGEALTGVNRSQTPGGEDGEEGTQPVR